MFDTPVRKYRPSKSYDGEGSTQELGSAVTLWVDVLVHGAKTEMVVASEEDVNIGDLILLPHP